MKEILENYFIAWTKKDWNLLKNTIDENCIVIECNGPIYEGILEIEKWFKTWNKNNTVTRWTITNKLEDIENETIIFEWEFFCNYNKVDYEFDGCTIAVIKNNKIVLLKEFMMDRKHNYPYK